MMSRFLIPLFLCLLTLNPVTSLACKGFVPLNFEYWLKQNDEALQRNHCVREQIKFRMFLSKGDTENIIKSGKKIRKQHVFDKIDLKSEANALYNAKRFDEALGVFLLSQDASEQCHLFIDICLRAWNSTYRDEHIYDHYLLYKYYRAANRNMAANVALKEANIEYEKKKGHQPDLQKIFQWLELSQ
jgi:hypothetical protein